MADSKLSEMIGTSLEKVRELASTDTVVGEPITTPDGTTIIPVSKVSMGFVSGGMDYDGKNAKDQSGKELHFGGGGGTGISITPIAFLFITPDGTVDIRQITTPGDTLDKVTVMAEKAPSILDRIVDIFRKGGKETNAKKEDGAEEPAEDGAAE